VFGQPKKPAVVNSKPTSGSNATKPAEDKGEEEKPAVPSKGASLLGKMGWSAGQGLGAQGTGMMTPIATDVYAQGVGLGAEGGKRGNAIVEAERNTKGGYEAFLERTKDGAKARFESLKEG
jgi:RNA-binding protein 5/10